MGCRELSAGGKQTTEGMFASLLRRQRGPRGSERSPFFSAFNRARTGADEDYSASDSGDGDNFADDAEHSAGEEDEDNDVEDDDGNQEGPLLPVFSEFLGISLFTYYSKLFTLTMIAARSTAHLQRHPFNKNPCHSEMRNHPVVGSTSIPTSLTIPHQAYSTADTVLVLLSRYTICINSKLFTVPEGGPDKSWECGS